MTSKAEVTRLEKVLNFANGRTSPIRDDDLSIPVYGSNGLIGRASESNSSEGTIVIGRVGSYCGSVHFSKESCWVTDNAIKATAKDGNDPFFLYYILKYLNLNNWRSGSGQPLLNQSTLNAIEALIPPYSVQLQISSFLYAIDDRIKLLQETNSTLESIAQALFKSWFVDFDPVRAKQEGRQSEGMDEATAALFPDTFETTKLGELPTAWRISNIGAELTSILGGTPSRARPEFWKEGSVAWINSGKVNEYRITTASELITDEALSRSATKLLPARTTVLAITGATLGQISIVEIAACANQSVIGILQNEKFSTEFIYFWINFNIKKLISSQTGGAQQHINKGNVEELPLLVPDIQILNRFKSIAQPLFIKIAENCFQISTLSSIRDSLLPRLISGQIRLPDYEEQIGTATT